MAGAGAGPPAASPPAPAAAPTCAALPERHPPRLVKPPAGTAGSAAAAAAAVTPCRWHPSARRGLLRLQVCDRLAALSARPSPTGPKACPGPSRHDVPAVLVGTACMKGRWVSDRGGGAGRATCTPAAQETGASRRRGRQRRTQGTAVVCSKPTGRRLTPGAASWAKVPRGWGGQGAWACAAPAAAARRCCAGRVALQQARPLGTAAAAAATAAAAARPAPARSAPAGVLPPTAPTSGGRGEGGGRGTAGAERGGRWAGGRGVRIGKDLGLPPAAASPACPTATESCPLAYAPRTYHASAQGRRSTLRSRLPLHTEASCCPPTEPQNLCVPTRTLRRATAPHTLPWHLPTCCCISCIARHSCSCCVSCASNCRRCRACCSSHSLLCLARCARHVAWGVQRSEGKVAVSAKQGAGGEARRAGGGGGGGGGQ